MIKIAYQALKTTKDIIELFTEDRQKIEDLDRQPFLCYYLETHSVTDLGKIVAHCNITILTATKSIKQLKH